MARARKREAAKRDLIAQWVWYAENASIDIADQFLKVADDTVLMLAGQPEAGYRFFVRRPELQGMEVTVFVRREVRFPIGSSEVR